MASIEPSARACSAVARVRFQPRTRLSVRALMVFRHRAAHQTESGNEYGIKHEWVPPVANFIQIKCITARRLCQGGLFRRQALEHAVVQAVRIAVLAALLEGEFVIKALRAQVFFSATWAHSQVFPSERYTLMA